MGLGAQPGGGSGYARCDAAHRAVNLGVGRSGATIHGAMLRIVRSTMRGVWRGTVHDAMLRIMRLVWVRPTFGCILARHYTRWDAAHRACGGVGLVWMRLTSGFWRGL